jgi:hypothetical protein
VKTLKTLLWVLMALAHFGNGWAQHQGVTFPAAIVDDSAPLSGLVIQPP